MTPFFLASTRVIEDFARTLREFPPQDDLREPTGAAPERRRCGERGEVRVFKPCAEVMAARFAILLLLDLTR
jgi:hypothetical protein